MVVGVVEGDEVKKDFAAMSGLAALGGFVMRQWMNYERRSLKYRASGTGQSGLVTGPDMQGIRDSECFLPESDSGGLQGARAHRSGAA